MAVLRAFAIPFDDDDSAVILNPSDISKVCVDHILLARALSDVCLLCA
jgi:hypothetical protein